MNPAPVSWSLEEVLARGGVVAQFQPVLSVKSQAALMVEGLCRGVENGVKRLISPLRLLEEARREEKLPRLDRLFRRKTLEAFQKGLRFHSNLILSLNFEASLIDFGELGPEDLLEDVRQWRLNPKQIVLEVVEAEVENLHTLRQFIEKQKEYGFLIALDDVGAGHSNLNRIAALRPDFLKLDRTLIVDIARDEYKQEIFKSLVQLARGIGALVVAEGVEKEEEALMTLELGTDLLQGYFFSKPLSLKKGFLAESQDRLEYLASKFRQRMLQRQKQRKELHRVYDELLKHFIETLGTVSPRKFDVLLKEQVQEFHAVQCAYILDEGGMQMTQMHFPKARTVAPVTAKSLFKAMGRGTDHSMKDYYYCLVEGELESSVYVTPDYVSLATGERCRTISALFYDRNGRKNILCLDLNPPPHHFDELFSS